MDLYYAWFKGRTLHWSCAWCFLVFGVIMIIKTYIFYVLGFYLIFQGLLILAIIKIWLYSYTAQMLSFRYAHWPWEIVRRIVFLFFNKIQDGQRITCYSHELLYRFVPRKHLTLDIC